MFKQFSAIGLIALAVSSVFGDLLAFDGDNCQGGAKVYTRNFPCAVILAAKSYTVVPTGESGWSVMDGPQCGGKSFLIGAGRGCINKSVVGFDAHSARPVWG